MTSRRCTLMFIISLAIFTSFIGLPCVAQEENLQEFTHTDWLYQAKWGVFTHYLSDTVGQPQLIASTSTAMTTSTAPAAAGQEMTIERWNQLVDSFDTGALAKQLADAGAGYYFITLGQNSGFYCSPNATYDNLVGIKPSKCSRRDLIADLYEALEPRGIRLMVYLPSGAPDRDPVAIKALGWNQGSNRNQEFQIKWENVIREWSNRWGSKVKGWWFDGCYFADAMYRCAESPNFASFAAAARSGNPDSIVAFNPGIEIKRMTPYEDYTAGETNDPISMKCNGRWVDGAQWHMLSFLGKSWYFGQPRFTNQQVIDISRKVIDCDGVVTWDVPITADGRIPKPFFNQLKALGKALEVKRAEQAGKEK